MHQDTEDGKEAVQANMVGLETQTVNSARVPPVLKVDLRLLVVTVEIVNAHSESYTITLWASTEIDNETSEEQADDEDD